MDAITDANNRRNATRTAAKTAGVPTAHIEEVVAHANGYRLDQGIADGRIGIYYDKSAKRVTYTGTLTQHELYFQ